MLQILKGLFGPGGRVSLERRFSIACETPQGSMSRVYRAVDKESGRTICLKIQLADKQNAAESRADRVTRPPEGDIAMSGRPSQCRTDLRTWDHDRRMSDFWSWNSCSASASSSSGRRPRLGLQGPRLACSPRRPTPWRPCMPPDSSITTSIRTTSWSITITSSS